MTKYHVNSKGEAGKCGAKKGNCPFGGDNEHYDSIEKAQAAAEQYLDAQHGSFVSVSKPPADDTVSEEYRAGRRDAATAITERHLEQAGLDYWSVEIRDDLGNMVGQARHGDQTIVLGEEHVVNASPEAVLNTIKHEVAHAKVGYGQGHNHNWKHAARELGMQNPTAKTYGEAIDKKIAEGKLRVSDVDRSAGRFARAPQSQFADRHKAPEEKKVAAKARKQAKELDPQIIEALKFKYLKKFKEPFDESGLSIPELLQMAREGQLD